MREYKTLFLNERDSVAVALSDIPAEAEVIVKADGKKFHVKILEPIRFGHKFAVRAIPQGEDIIKYGEVIGAAVAPIDAGEHVHVHNLEGKRGRGDKIVQ
ncbi:UxaA family hydrolase [Cytobacillus firmus]|uniref:UxaA family hydrolase n=1 Tax=Cytobacillus firmus TaxID=1399 RepID=UPI002495270A|nr:UxaA family hydrolase [Cytobacillus firmus]